MLGDHCVGKSSLVQSWATKGMVFLEDYEPTLSPVCTRIDLATTDGRGPVCLTLHEEPVQDIDCLPPSLMFQVHIRARRRRGRSSWY